MTETKKRILFLIFIVILCICFIFIPFQLSKNNIFLGGDSVGSAGTVEQIYLKLKKGEISFVDIFLGKGLLLDEINWPDGFYIAPSIATGINVVLRFIFWDEISAFTATLILFEILNILSVFFILRKIFNINFFLSVFFSVIVIFFPYFYFRIHHQSLVSFWQELFLIYFVVKFIDKPVLYLMIYIIIFIFINIFYNIQTSYFLFLTFLPAIVIAIIFRMKNLQNNQNEYFKKFFIYSFFIVFIAGIIFYFSPYGGYKRISDQNIYKQFVLPERDKNEIRIWKAPIYHLFLPTDNNILFGEITGKKFTSKWGYHEKAIYLGVFLLIFYLFLLYKILKKFKSEQLLSQILNYNFKGLFLKTGFFIFLFSIFWTIAPALYLENFLYFLNKSVRVYSRAISLAIVFWVIIFAFLIDYSFKNKLIKTYMVFIMILFIFLDIFPKNFKWLCLKLEKCPEEYIFLSDISKEKEIFLDYFGRYGGYAEYGHILYKKCHNLIDFNMNLVDNKWGRELYDVLKNYNIKYVLFYKDNKEKNIDKNKIEEFIKKFRLKKIFENKRSIIIKI